MKTSIMTDFSAGAKPILVHEPANHDPKGRVRYDPVSAAFYIPDGEGHYIVVGVEDFIEEALK